MTSFISFLIAFLSLGEEHNEQLSNFQESSEYYDYEYQWEQTDETIFTFDDLESY